MSIKGIYGSFFILSTANILNIHNLMKTMRNFIEIKGVTVNLLSRHQTWVPALTFTMTIEQSYSQGELY